MEKYISTDRAFYIIQKAWWVNLYKWFVFGSEIGDQVIHFERRDSFSLSCHFISTLLHIHNILKVMYNVHSTYSLGT